MLSEFLLHDVQIDFWLFTTVIQNQDEDCKIYSATDEYKLMSDPDEYLSPIGGFLRRSSLDELPQLLSILKGDMSFVGPRPALFNQDDLIALRTEKGVDKLIPGLTGWAQVNGRDELPIPEKVALDVEYIKRQSFWFDLYILFLTIRKVIKRDGVSH